MKKEVICKQCKKNIPVKSGATDRAELARALGKTFELNCPHCNTKRKYHVNDVKATKSKVLSSLTLLIMWILTAIIGYFIFSKYGNRLFFLVYLIPLTVGIPAATYFLYAKSENDAIRRFNRFRK